MRGASRPESVFWWCSTPCSWSARSRWNCQLLPIKQ